MKVDIISKYSLNKYYSNIYGTKTLKKPKKNNQIKSENKGQYIDLKI